MDCEERPLAHSEREIAARQMFPLDVSPELYAARESHRWVCFSFHDYRYRDEALDRWIQRFAEIIFCADGAPSIEELRESLLTTEERAAIDEEIRQEREADEL